MKRLQMLGFALVAFSGAATAAHADSYLSGSFDISVYQGTCNPCDINSAGEQAQTGNPFITSGDLLYSGVYSGALNFTDNGSGTGNILTFLDSAFGSLSGNTSALNVPISSSSFDLTTVMVITGVLGGTVAGTVDHDDGVSIYDTAGTVVSAPIPTSDTGSSYSGLTGDFKIVYVEANGLPADLEVGVNDVLEGPGTSVATPLPAGLPLFATGLGALGLLGWRRKRKDSAAFVTG